MEQRMKHKNRRKPTLDEIEIAEQKKRRKFVEAGGKCHYCKHPFTDISQSQMAHRIIQGYREVYGTAIVDHYLNFRLTCGDCNSKAIVWPDTQSGRDLIREISEALLYY
jgi:5-methylcytosine-specific restriction endonuclease McrA